MRAAIDIRKNILVRECLEEAKAEGREEGSEEGRDEADAEILITLLDAKFGNCRTRQRSASIAPPRLRDAIGLARF